MPSPAPISSTDTEVFWQMPRQLPICQLTDEKKVGVIKNFFPSGIATHLKRHRKKNQPHHLALLKFGPQ
jgi:hypothetical protein